MLILGAPVSWPWALLTTQLLYCFVAKTLGSQGSVAYPWTFSVSSSCLPSTNWGTAGNSESPSLDAATAPSPGHPQTEDGSQSVFPVMWGYLHRGCSERCWDFRSEKAHSHPAISGEPGGLWLLSLPPHIQVTSRRSGPVSLGLLLSLSRGWEGLREGLCLVCLRLTPGLAKNSAPSNCLPPSPYPSSSSVTLMSC